MITNITDHFQILPDFYFQIKRIFAIRFATWIRKIYSAVKGIVHASAVHSHTAVFCQFTDRN